MATLNTRNEEEAQDLQDKGWYLLMVKGTGLKREYIFAEGKEKLVEPAPSEKPKSRRGRRKKK